MPYAEVNDIAMYYEEMGSGPVLLLMHGALGAIDYPFGGWADLMPLFAKNYRVIHIEYRGHGRTDNPAGFVNYAMIADDVCEFIEQLGLGAPHIGGISDGAIAALHIGMTRPELASTLICVGANYYNDDLCIEANKTFDVEHIEQQGPEAVAKWSALHDRNKQTGYWRELVRQTAANVAVNPSYTTAYLAQIPVPVLLMSGENDPYANPTQMLAMRRAIPSSEMLIINNAEHVIQHTHANIVGPQVLDFLARHETKVEVKSAPEACKTLR